MNRPIRRVAACFALLLAVPPAGSAALPARETTLLTVGAVQTAFFRDATDDGARIYFDTPSSLVPADSDLVRDFYERRPDGSYRLLSPGTTDNVNGAGANADGTLAAFETTTALVPGDSGATMDTYTVDAAGALTLVSAGDPSAASTLEFATPDLRHIVFRTAAVVPGLGVTPGGAYCYVRGPAGVRLVSSGQATDAAGCEGISDDGSRAWFSAEEDLDGAATGDGDAVGDLYERRADGSLVLTTPGTTHVNPPLFAGASADGTVVAFTAEQEPILGDTDAFLDAFVHRSTGVDLISPGTPTLSVSGVRVAPDGSRVWFVAQDELVGTPAENDGVASDIYEWRPDGSIVLRSPGTPDEALLRGTTPDGDRVYYSTIANVVGTDADGQTDVYEHRQSTGATRLITAGTGPVQEFLAASDDGREVFFSTDEVLVPATDSGTGATIYARQADGSVRQVSPSAGNASIVFRRSTRDGGRVFFIAQSGLPGDNDPAEDIFMTAFGPPTVAVQITGTNRRGSVLTCAPTVESELPVTTARRWLRNDVPVAGATAATLTLGRADVGRRITCAVTATVVSSVGEATGQATVTIRPTVSGVRVSPTKARIGSKLRCIGSVTGATSVRRAWLRGSVVIAGANRTTYTVRARDAGKQVRCRVTARNAGGSTIVRSKGIRIRR
jgi:hypothetical protein